jgi:hypothetical protein
MFHAIGPKATGSRCKDNYSTPPGVFFKNAWSCASDPYTSLFRDAELSAGINVGLPAISNRLKELALNLLIYRQLRFYPFLLNFRNLKWTTDSVITLWKSILPCYAWNSCPKEVRGWQFGKHFWQILTGNLKFRSYIFYLNSQKLLRGSRNIVRN